jgi:3-dehydroquinate synthase
VDVRLGPQSYPVHIGNGLLASIGEHAREVGLAGRCALITDRNVGKLYAQRALASLEEFRPELITVPAGEESKSLAQAEAVCDQMIASGLDRSSFVVALGGGVIGDLAGFVAAIYFRGIPYLQVPTTIVGQVDSAVGGKTGVNAAAGKNLIGAFHQPAAVIADVETLATLPEREFHEGFAEVIKHAIIRDASMFDALENFDRAGLEPLITRNVEIKAAIVSADEHETKGERALLNFGHTIGHAIEKAAGYGQMFHGEAVALGIAAAAGLSVQFAGLSGEENQRILARLAQFHLPTRLPAGIESESVMAALRTDKKFAAGRVRFVLTSRIGSAFISESITLDQIENAVAKLR